MANGNHIVVGITGSIAVIKIPELVSVLTKQGYRISVILTQAATAIISPEVFKNMGIPTYTDLFAVPVASSDILEKRSVEHINVAKSADLLVIAPATANTLAKLAYGIADDYLTTAALAATCPMIVCPAMNVHMWTHPATQQNIHTLQARGVTMVEPVEGMLACGDIGSGKLATIETIIEHINNITKTTKQLEGKTVLVTAGGTKETIDDVRFITNKSSGKMGVAIAEAAKQRGAHVILLRASSSVRCRFSVEEYTFETADDLETLIHLHVPKADYCFHTAAVSDFAVKKKKGKLSSDKKQILKLSPRNKILHHIKTWNPHVFLVGFKAEAGLTDEQLITQAIKRAKTSGADAIAANHIDRPNQGFGVETNEIFLVSQKEFIQHFPNTSKRLLADHILDSVTMF